VHELVEVASWVNVVAFVALAAVAARQFRSRHDRAGLWAALAFGVLGVVVVLGRIVPTHPHDLADRIGQRFEVAVLLLFPYLLFRFTMVFRDSAQRVYGLLSLLTVALVAWSFALPRIPAAGEPRSPAFQAYLVVYLVHWIAFSGAAAARLWRAGSSQPSVARRRMRLLATAAAALAFALVLAAAAANSDSPASAAGQLLAFVSAIAFLLALAPPPLLRLLWRRAEQERMQEAIQQLLQLATRQEEVAQRVLEPTAAIVGARALSVRNEQGMTIAEFGAPDPGDEPVEIGAGSSTLTVWTNPYAPFFGGEELALVRTLAALTGIALDRVRLYEQEHAARVQLERANQLQANFVALAAHELRTPVTSIHGFVQTLHHLGDRLDERQRAELEEALAQQTARMASLVEQLLDLSRLDADAIEINPLPLALRRHLQDIVDGAAGARSELVEVDVDPALEARVDPGAFDRIVGNLVTNALKYGAPPVVVRAHQRDRHLRVAVEDRGRGISPEFVPDLFERFSRSDHSRGDAGGTGLGLAIARSYARAHAGELTYEPLAPHGSRFELVLPVSDDS
jgi:signal transduction histidine kinase